MPNANILYTAFKGKNNTSYQLVSQLNGDALYLTNSFHGLEKDITAITSDYEVIYMFGIDKTLKNEVRIETCANFNGELLSSCFNVLDLKRRLHGKILNSVSNTPTKYLCNAAHCHMLKKNANTVFIHIPSIFGMSKHLMDCLIEFFN